MTLSNPELKQAAYNYGWHSILSHFGVDPVCLDNLPNKRSFCPICGGNTHSTHFDYRNKSADETYHCFKCGGGDGFKLLYKFNGTGFGDVARLIRGNSTSIPTSKPVAITASSKHKPDEDKTKKLERLKRAIEYSGHTPRQWGIDYLEGRGIRFKNPKQKLDFIRYGSGYYMDRFIPDSTGKPTYHNCLLFPLSQHHSGVSGLVRVYTSMAKVKQALIDRGEDANKLPNKPMLVIKTVSGSGVWFSKNVNNKILHVGEGIENTLSVLQSLRAINGVASVTAGLMGKLIIPNHVEKIHIWKDSGDAGDAGADELSRRYEGDMDIIIHSPPQDMDWNDVLINSGEHEIAHKFVEKIS
jgi:hypothetical protein